MNPKTQFQKMRANRETMQRMQFISEFRRMHASQIEQRQSNGLLALFEKYINPWLFNKSGGHA